MDGMEIEIFKPGTYTAMDGQARTYGEAELRAIADAYDPAVYEAPVVIGHPKVDAPAWGWVKGLTYADGALKAVLHKVAPVFAEMVKAGRYRNRSASFWPPTAPNNPTPGKVHLRHLGFLGALPPAVKGLAPLNFSDDADAVVIEFGEPGAAGNDCEDVAAMRARLAELEAENQKLAQEKRAGEHLAYVDELIRSGHILPREADGMVAFMDAVDGAGVEEICFADHDGVQQAKTVLEFLRDFFANRPPLIEFGELAPAGDFNDGDTDTAALSYADQVEEWVKDQRAKGRNVTYADFPTDQYRRQSR